MFLANIKIWNFRKYGCEEFDLTRPSLSLNLTKGLNVLIGENDSGKTAIIDAIKLVLKTHSYEWIKTLAEDFTVKTNRLRIELLFKDLSDEEAKHFTEYLSFQKDGEQETIVLRLIYDVKRIGTRILPSEVRAGGDDIGIPLSAEAKELLKITYLKPLRDAKSELIPRRNSRLSQILQGHDAFKDKEESHHLIEVFRYFNNSIEKYFEGRKIELNNDSGEVGEVQIEDQLGRELKDEIDRYLRSFFTKEKRAQLSVSDASLRMVLERLFLNIAGDFNLGLGSLNRLFMATELLHLNKKNWEGLRLGLIEELEAHLHPQAQMQVIETLQAEEDIQLILTTHSPNLASKVALEDIVFCTGNNAFPMGKDYTQLDNYSFLERFLDVTKSNLFFAKGVLLVEGWSEELLLPAIAKRLKHQEVIAKDLTEAGVTVVNIGNIEFSNYSNIFLRKDEENKIATPVAIVTDSDVKAYDRVCIGKNGKRKVYAYQKIDVHIFEQELEERLGEIKEQYNHQNVKSFIGEQWTLEYCFFHSTSLQQLFLTACKRLYPNIEKGNAELNIAKRLINKDIKKTNIAYFMASAIETGSFLDEDGAQVPVEIHADDKSISYLIEAIKYASGD